ncbi:CHAT domain-containing protein [Saccharothrix xinjiangensis]
MQAAVGFFIEAVERLPPGHEDRAGYLQALAAGLRLVFERTGERWALQDAVQRLHEALESRPVPELERVLLADLWGCLLLAAQADGDDALLREAVTNLRVVVAAAPATDAYACGIRVHLGQALRSWYERTGDPQALDEAVDVLRPAVTTAHEHLALARHTLGVVLRIRSGPARDDHDLDTAVELLGLAVTASRPGEPDHAMFLGSHGNALLTRALRSSARPGIEVAVSALRRAVAATPGDHPDRAAALNNLGVALRMAATRSADTSLAREAVDVGRRAVAASAVGSVPCALHLHGLAAGLAGLFGRTGDEAVLREAVDVAMRSIAATPPDHARRPMHLHLLGVVHLQLFEWTGELAVLHDAVTSAEAAVAGTPRHRPCRGIYLMGLGNALRALVTRTGDERVLARAVEVLRQAEEAMSPDLPESAVVLNNLGSALLATYAGGGDEAALREAVEITRRAVAGTPSDHPDFAGHVHNLGAALRAVFLHDGSGEALTESVVRLRQAVVATPDGHPRRAVRLTSLGASAQLLFGRTGDPSALDEARSAHTAAAGADSAPAGIRVTAARGAAWAATTAGDTAAALAAHESAVALLPQVSPRRLARVDREFGLGGIAGLPAEAAAAAFDAGHVERAVELLEAARGRLLAEGMDAHGDLSALRANAPDLEEDFLHLRDALDAVEGADAAPLVVVAGIEATGRDATAEPLAGVDRIAEHDDNRRRRLANDWEALLTRIRSRPGLGGFLRPPSFADLRAVADQGPVVFVIAGDRRSDAVVLPGPDRAPRLVPLPLLSSVAVAEHVRRLPAALEDPSDPVLTTVLGWLWDAVAEPVLAALGPTGPDRPRLWWCAVGALAHLPLHAAGRHGAGEANLLDRVISSYTPTLGALRHARRPANRTGSDGMLIVAMPRTPHAPDLPGVSAEADRVSRMVPGSRVLTGPDATSRTVLAALPRHRIAHLACHGRSGRDDPAAATLLLHDHTTDPLTLRRISALRLTGAELAYLSACETTLGPALLVDEALHITAAFQLAGYRQVIGTLWPVRDRIATRVATAVHSRLTDSGRTGARVELGASAVDEAVRRVRGAYPRAPALWAGFLHVGA